jgi:hypothetical protein
MNTFKKFLYRLIAFIDLLNLGGALKIFIDIKSSDYCVLEDDSIEAEVSLFQILDTWTDTYSDWWDTIVSYNCNPNNTPWFYAAKSAYYKAHRELGTPLRQAMSDHHKRWRNKKLNEKRSSSFDDYPIEEYRKEQSYWE